VSEKTWSSLPDVPALHQVLELPDDDLTALPELPELPELPGSWADVALPELPEFPLPADSGVMSDSLADIALPKLPDCPLPAADLALPELPECPLPADSGMMCDSDSLADVELPDLPELSMPAGSALMADGFPGDVPRKKLWEQPFMRSTALQDIPQLAAQYGDDLREVPADWFNPALARVTLLALGWAVCFTPVFFMELFAGCAHLTQACVEAGLSTAPSIDILPADGGHRCVLDLLTAHGRQVVWAFLVVLKPNWVHIGYPCTFWSQMAHLTRKRSAAENEATRLQELVYITFARQIVRWQASRWQHASVENPPRCRSWHLDVVRDMLQIGCMQCVDTDLCRWGAVDPGNGLPYKKGMRLGSTVDLSVLGVRCCGGHTHQRVEGAVSIGPCKGVARSRVSGEYPIDFCRAWVAHMRASLLAV